jgi:tetratricopeptide (TPR) repeat protein
MDRLSVSSPAASIVPSIDGAPDRMAPFPGSHRHRPPRSVPLVQAAILVAHLALLTLSCGAPAHQEPREASARTRNEAALRARLRGAMLADGVSATLLHRIAASYWRSGQVDSSRQLLEQAVLLDSHHVPSLTWLSRIYYEHGDLAAGIALLQPVVDEAPDIDAEILTNLSVLRLASGDTTAAESLLRHCAERFPDHAPARGNLGYLDLCRGAPGRAISELEAAIRLDPTVPEFHNNLGIALRKTGDFGHAVRAFEQAIAIEPAFLEAHHNLAVLFKLDLFDDDRARQHYRSYIALGGRPRQELMALFRPPPPRTR